LVEIPKSSNSLTNDIICDTFNLAQGLLPGTTMTQTIEVNLADILNKIDQRLDRIEQSVNDLKVTVARTEAKIESLDEKIDSQGKILEAKIDGLDKRIVNQEFINRSVLAALIVGIIGGFAKLFGFIDKA
jgi:peptidoglycan hydrolase CwlO-like protein